VKGEIAQLRNGRSVCLIPNQTENAAHHRHQGECTRERGGKSGKSRERVHRVWWVRQQTSSVKSDASGLARGEDREECERGKDVFKEDPSSDFAR